MSTAQFGLLLAAGTGIWLVLLAAAWRTVHLANDFAAIVKSHTPQG